MWSHWLHQWLNPDGNQEPARRVLYSSLDLEHQSTIRDIWESLLQQLAHPKALPIGDWIGRISFGNELDDQDEDEEPNPTRWTAQALSLVLLAKNLHTLHLGTWAQFILAAASQSHANTLQSLVVSLDSWNALQQFMDSAQWINMLTRLTTLEIGTDALDFDDLLPEPLQISTLCLPSLRCLHYHGWDEDGLFELFARAELPALGEVTIYFPTDDIAIHEADRAEHLAQFFHKHPQLHSVNIHGGALADVVVPVIRAESLHIRDLHAAVRERVLNSPLFQLLSPSIKTLRFSEIESDPNSAFWDVLGRLATTESSVTAVHLLSTYAARFLWMPNINHTLVPKDLQAIGRLVSYVPVLHRRGIHIFDDAGRTLGDYLPARSETAY
jgi:hypothetical protein